MASDNDSFAGKILITIADDMIAPRFDLCTEVLIVRVENNQNTESPRSMLLPGASVDELCGLILKENITVLICGGIEEEHYQFLTWKKVNVIDRVIGRVTDVLEVFLSGALRPGAVVRNRG